MTRDPLPIDDVLPAVVAALRDHGRVVIEAPPGAGKTTRVPPAVLDSVDGRVVVLEPRRVAARAAANRMAAERGERLGGTVGLTTGDERRVSRDTRIEVVTEGVLVRRLQADPGLPGVGAIVLDEFHERSLDADLALAFGWEARELRGDLAIIVMSATLDGDRVAALLDDAPVVRSDGRLHPVEVHHIDRDPVAPLAPDGRGRHSPTTTATCSSSFPACGRSAPWRGRCTRHRAWTSGRCTARCPRPSRMRRYGPRRPAAAPSCSRPTSPNRRSRCRGSGWSSTRDLPASPASTPAPA